MIVATTPEPHPAKCVVRGDALFHAVARAAHTFEVEFRDKLGITTHGVELDVFVENLPPGSPRGRNSPRRPPKPEFGSGTSGKGRHHAMTMPSPDTPTQQPPSLQGAAKVEPGKEGTSVVADHGGGTIIPAHNTSSAVSIASASASFRLRSKQSPTTAATADSPARKLRNIRVKVGDTPLTVRKGPEPDAQPLCELLPGTMVTCIEERITPGNGEPQQ